MQIFSLLYQELQSNYSQMVQWRRRMHQQPELSFQEEWTPRFIADTLQGFGLEVQTGVGGRGVVGRIRGGRKGKTVALRADFDALPIQDEKDVPYKSLVPGVMHACGHDAHTATLLGVAAALQAVREHLQGDVVMIHQFAEEVDPGGAQPMIADGCLEGVDAIFGTHLWSGFPLGKIGLRTGATMAASDSFEMEVLGKGGHGAYPHETVDALHLACQVVTQMQAVVSRRVDPLKSAVLSFGALHSGNAFNVIPDSAKLKGTVRTFDERVRQQMEEEMRRVLQGLCQAAGATYRFHYQKGYPAVVNHEAETRFLKDTVCSLFGEDALLSIDPLMAGEDFAFYLQKVPGAFFFTGAGNPAVQAVYSHHHPRFDIDERAMLNAAHILASAAVLYGGGDRDVRIPGAEYHSL